MIRLIRAVTPTASVSTVCANRGGASGSSRAERREDRHERGGQAARHEDVEQELGEDERGVVGVQLRARAIGPGEDPVAHETGPVGRERQHAEQDRPRRHEAGEQGARPSEQPLLRWAPGWALGLGRAGRAGWDGTDCARLAPADAGAGGRRPVRPGTTPPAGTRSCRTGAHPTGPIPPEAGPSYPVGAPDRARSRRLGRAVHRRTDPNERWLTGTRAGHGGRASRRGRHARAETGVS